MGVRKWVGGIAVFVGLTSVLLSVSSGKEECPVIDTTTAQGQHYRLSGVCVAVEENQVDALLDEGWSLSVWTGEQFVPVVAVVDEYQWVGSSAVQLKFMTLNEDVKVHITESMNNNT